jgi:flagellar basal body rod protein FlgG
MMRGLYDAATALQEALNNQEVSAANLANSTTTSYRRQGYAFGTFAATLDQAISGLPTGAAAGATGSGIYTSFDPGPFQNTGRPLDLAITGDGYFVLSGGPGGTLYTRNGSFELNSEGQLQTTSGLTVQGEGGPIFIPPTASRITVGPDGIVLADNNQVGRIQLARFPNPRGTLRRVGDTLFQGPPPPVQQELGDVRVEQGYREGSNVQVVREMVLMLSGMRYYEASERALRTLSEAQSQNTRPGT